MADDERRMVFDIRGRRKNVVKVVYAILALLMGLSLLLLAGPGLGTLFNSGTSTEASDALEDRAARIEQKLRKDPQDPELLLNLARTRINISNVLSPVNPETGQAGTTFEARVELEKAADAWSRYLEATDEPTPGGAQLAGGALFRLAQTSRTGAEAEANLDAAADAQQIVADARPSLGSLGTLAIYRYYGFDFAEADRIRKVALSKTTSKFERENLENELEQTEKRAREFKAQVAKFNKANKGRARETLENPLGGVNTGGIGG
jgi:hypothetical protein